MLVVGRYCCILLGVDLCIRSVLIISMTSVVCSKNARKFEVIKDWTRAISTTHQRIHFLDGVTDSMGKYLNDHLDTLWYSVEVHRRAPATWDTVLTQASISRQLPLMDSLIFSLVIKYQSTLIDLFQRAIILIAPLRPVHLDQLVMGCSWRSIHP